MEKMNNSTPKPEETTIILGKRDSILNYLTKWPMYRLHLFDKKGLWLKFKNKLNDLNEKKLLESVLEEDILKYYDDNLDVELEILIFDNIFQKQNIFKYKNTIYSYSIGKKTKNTKRIAYVRFYFNLNEFFNY
jgi:hypothetical protein